MTYLTSSGLPDAFSRATHKLKTRKLAAGQDTNETSSGKTERLLPALACFRADTKPTAVRRDVTD